MIVYVESNFVLEIAFAQEESESCDSVLELAESGKINLYIPAISISEPYEVILRRSRNRVDLNNRLTVELNQLSRSRPYSEIADRSQEIVSLLISSGENEKLRLDSTLSRILDCAGVLPIEGITLRSAIEYQSSLNLSPQDSLVYSAVVNHLESTPAEEKCFLNRNSKDFLIPDIESQLAALQCVMIPRFSDGVEYIRNSL